MVLRDGFLACHDIFLAKRPPQWQPHQRHAAFHFSKSRQVLPLVSVLFFFVKQIKWKSNWRFVSLWPHCALFCPLPLLATQQLCLKYQIFFTKKKFMFSILFVTCPYPPITWLNKKISWSALLFLSALDIKNIFGPIFVMMRSRNCLLTKCQYMSYTTTTYVLFFANNINRQLLLQIFVALLFQKSWCRSPCVIFRSLVLARIEDLQ